MKKFLLLLFVGILWPFSAGAVSPDQIAGKLYQQAIQHPQNVETYGLIGCFVSENYKNFIFAQVNILLGKQESVSLAALLKKTYFAAEFSGLSDEQHARLAEIAGKQAPAGAVSEPELLTMLVLLDANLEHNEAYDKQMFKMDTYPSLARTGGLIEARPNEIDKLLEYMGKHTREKEKEREEARAAREAQRDREERASLAEAETAFKEELQRKPVQVFNADGSLNGPDVAKAMGRLRAFAVADGAPYLQRSATLVFGKKLKSAVWTGTRSNDVKVELTDGTQITTKWSLTVEVKITYPNGEEQTF